ncbi:MAG TPA: SRPBCC family protein [Conexibacter sp.]|nr:SRPBCC family protein [Conexibacter sp.]
MPQTRVSRTLAAAPDAVWSVVSDPHHQPRWWPRVRRVEDVTDEQWTQVLATAKGGGIRADFRLLEREQGRRLRWTQELEGSPFERLLVQAETTVELEPDSGGTRVTIELRQRLRGWSRLVPFLFKGAARRQLTEALEGLDEAVVAR